MCHKILIGSVPESYRVCDNEPNKHKHKPRLIFAFRMLNPSFFCQIFNVPFPSELLPFHLLLTPSLKAFSSSKTSLQTSMKYFIYKMKKFKSNLRKTKKKKWLHVLLIWNNLRPSLYIKAVIKRQVISALNCARPGDVCSATSSINLSLSRLSDS